MILELVLIQSQVVKGVVKSLSIQVHVDRFHSAINRAGFERIISEDDFRVWCLLRLGL